MEILTHADFAAAAFSSVTGDTGTATADTGSDTIALIGATNGGIATTATDGPEQVTFELDFADLTALGVAPAVGDLLAIADVDNSNAMRSITVTQLASAIQGATDLGDLNDVDTTAEAAGFALIYDNTASMWEAKKIQHTEAFGSSTQWVVTHDLNQQYPIVTVWDGSDQVIIPATITATSATVTTIDFAVATSGTVTLMAVNTD